MMFNVTPRQAVSSSVLFFFLFFFFFYGLSHEVVSHLPFTRGQNIPDFSDYRQLRTVSAADFPLDDSLRRVIIVGDIHGMFFHLMQLLEKASYDEESDVLVHVGDIITKGRHKESMKVLSYLASNNVMGVRGNHDQQVIERRGWINWVCSFPDGKQWLEQEYLKWQKGKADHGIVRLDPSANYQREKKTKRWSKTVPKGWKLFDDHFRIAYDMTNAEFEYLRSLPLRIHVPSAHTFIVHAGLLPSDPLHSYDNPRQPLARVPDLSSTRAMSSQNETVIILRRLQEQGILKMIPQNLEPWNTLNMRSILNGKVTKLEGGEKWSKTWNREISLCRGFGSNPEGFLPCYPSTVIYGHSASRSLDIKRWSIGLDTGCVYNRRLTALILGSRIEEPQDKGDGVIDRTESITFGDDGSGMTLSVSCS